MSVLGKFMWISLLVLLLSSEKLYFGAADELATDGRVKCITKTSGTSITAAAAAATTDATTSGTSTTLVTTATSAVNATNECPENSICRSEVNGNQTAFWCKCIANYELNRSYSRNVNETSNAANPSNESNTKNIYCLPNASSGIHVRQPAKVEHLAFGILLVLFVVIAVVALLYLLKISRPIKRSKAAYTRLKRRREQRQRLEEFNEDDISMIQLNENQKR